MVDVPRHTEPSDAERLHTFLARMTPGGAGGQSRAVGPILSRVSARAAVAGAGEEDTLDARESKIDQFAITGTGTSTFTLTFNALDDSWNVSCGYPLEDGVDYTISGQTVTTLRPTVTFIGASGTYPKTLQVQYDYLAGVPTEPTDLDGLYIVWLQPGDWETDAGGIFQWNDTSGNDFHAVQSGVNTPSVAVAVTPAGGDAADLLNPEYIQLPSGITTPLASGGEMFLVLKADASGGNGPHSVGGQAAYPVYGDASITDNFGSSTSHTFNPAFTSTDWNVYSVRSVAGDWKAFVNGVQVHSDASNAVEWTNVLRIGMSGLPFFSSVWWEGQVAEVIITVPLTDVQRSTIAASLAARHGL